jgi:hypothetical protein
LSALPSIADVGRLTQVSIWLSVYEYTPPRFAGVGANRNSE